MSRDKANQHTRVLLLSTPSSYRSAAFATAAERLGLEVLHGIDLPEALAQEWKVPLGVDFSRPHVAADKVLAYLADKPVDAVISVDDSATVLAALVSTRLGLPHNAPDAAEAARNKRVMRERMAEKGVPVPKFRRFRADEDPSTVADAVDYPCVVKPTLLSGSRGVIRADTDEELVAAFERTRRILASEGYDLAQVDILVEDFIPGFEIALEGLMVRGQLQVLALFDKPDPLDGPFFEETIYVTPSRLSEDTQTAIRDCIQRGALALDLREGPVHAELRINERGPWILEIAARSIGGLCSTVLEFGTGMSLEEIILQHAVGRDLGTIQRTNVSAGVMMIPIPGSGILREVQGVEDARAVPGITGIEITSRLGHSLVALPEGSSYLGFIFAQGEAPDQVEAAIREAHRHLRFRITPEIPLMPTHGLHRH